MVAPIVTVAHLMGNVHDQLVTCEIGVSSCYKQQTSASEKQGVTVRKCGAPGDGGDSNNKKKIICCCWCHMFSRKNGNRVSGVVD